MKHYFWSCVASCQSSFAELGRLSAYNYRDTNDKFVYEERNAGHLIVFGVYNWDNSAFEDLWGAWRADGCHVLQHGESPNF